MTESFLDLFEILLGTLFVSSGLFMAAFEASQNKFIGIMVGFILIAIGYQITVNFDSDKLPSFYSARDSVSLLETEDLVLATTGIFITSFGFRLLFRSVESQQIILGIPAALAMGTGYSLIHISLTNVAW